MNYIKQLFVLPILVFLIISCSNDDGEQVLENKTFLEIYDGKGFAGNDGEEFVYFFNTTSDFLSYVEVDIDGTICDSFSVGENSIDGEDIDVEITENTPTKLSIEIYYSSESITNFYNFVKINDTQISVDGDVYSLTSEPLSKFCN